jgi:DNA transformation protein
MKDESFTDFVLDQLAALPALECRKMFGGCGLYLGTNFFGIIYKGRLYFRVNDTTRGIYENRGMKAFQPKPSQVKKSYLEVPADVVEDAALVTDWARTAAATHGAG